MFTCVCVWTRQQDEYGSCCCLCAPRTPALCRGGSGWNNLGVSQLRGWRAEREAERRGSGRSAIAGVNMAETVRSLFDHRDPHCLDSDGEGVKAAPPMRGWGRPLSMTCSRKLFDDSVFLCSDRQTRWVCARVWGVVDETKVVFCQFRQ